MRACPTPPRAYCAAAKAASLTITPPALRMEIALFVSCRQQACGAACSSRSSPRPCARAEARARASVRLDRTSSRSRRSTGWWPPPIRYAVEAGYRILQAGRLGRRRRDRGAAGAGPRRAAVLGHRRRRVPAAARRRSRARSSRTTAARPRRRPRRPIASCEDGKPLEFYDAVRRRQVGRRARHAAPARSRASQARPAAVAAPVRAGDRAGRERLRAVAAPACAARARRSTSTQPRGRGATSSTPTATPLPVGATAAQSRLCAHAARDRCRWRGRVLHAAPIAQDIVDTVTAPVQSRRPDAGRSRRLQGRGARRRSASLPRATACAACDRRRRAAITVLQMLRHARAATTCAAMEPAASAACTVIARGRAARLRRSRPSTWPTRRSARRRAGLLDAGYLAARAALIDPTARMGRAQPGDAAARSAARSRIRPRTRRSSCRHLAHLDRRPRWQRGGDDHDHRGPVRQPAHDGGGFLLNNELTDFSFAPERGRQAGREPRRGAASGRARRWRRRSSSTRRPLWRSWPARRAAARSSTTWPRRWSAIIDWELDPQAAVALPNFGSRNGPTELEADTDVTSLAPKLRALGADVSVIEHDQRHAGDRAHARGWIGGADPRREGVVMGQ